MLMFTTLVAASSIAGLAPGKTVVLPAGDHPQIRIVRETFDPPVIIDASRSKVRGVLLRNVSGVIIKGGTIVAPEGKHPSRPVAGYAVSIRNSQNVSLQNMEITDAARGVVIGTSEGIKIQKVNFHDLRSDGLNIALSRKVLVEDIRCHDFSPNPKKYDSSGKMIKDGDHPDCVQAWSRPSHPPVSDVVIRRVIARGNMQGIFFGNQVRKGKDDGGYDRILIEDNDIKVQFPHGITLRSARDSIVRNNAVDTIPGGRHQFTTIRMSRQVNAIGCGNKVKGPAGKVKTAAQYMKACTGEQQAWQPANAPR